MRATAVVSRPGTKTASCFFCGGWPACLYKNLEEKHSHRVCETCVENKTVVKIDGIYVMNPEQPAATAESPDSGSRSSSEHGGAPGSAG